MNFIEHVHEPLRLLLVWQEPEGARTRRAVAEIERPHVSAPARLRYLVGTDDMASAKTEGFVCFPAFPDLDATYDLGVIETFMRRLPPRTRGDYGQYLEQFRLRPETRITDMALLAYTGAKLPSDGFSIVNPLDGVNAECELLIEVAGFRHVASIPSSELSLGSPAQLVAEPHNTFDPNAVAVHVDEHRIGCVPRQQALAVRQLVATNAITVTVERINGKPERPLIYLFARIHPASGATELRQG